MSAASTNETQTVRTGGCRCGAARYRATGKPVWVAHCHCVDCRKSSGAAFVTWAGWKRDAFGWDKDTAQKYQSSPGVERRFCGTCGTPLTYYGFRWADEMHVQVATLDDPESLPPRAHVNVAQQLSWIHLGDGLKRFAKTGADGAPLPATKTGAA
ncbi:MAG: GFA family protein [Alphaproteobacteria bacterium]